jgi:hypothetical protein
MPVARAENGSRSDPGAQGATAPGPSAAPVASVHGAKASRADARRPPIEGQQKRIAQRSGSARRDRAQTNRRAGHASAGREGKPRGCAAPAD